jgi:Domain of unknown function (DUF5615)
MTQIRLYLDEDIQRTDLVRALRSRGIDVLTADEAGMRNREDMDHLSYATNGSRVLHLFNIRHYADLHASLLSQNGSHAGIILAQQQRYGVGEHMRRLLRLIHTVSADEMLDRIEYLGAWG